MSTGEHVQVRDRMVPIVASTALRFVDRAGRKILQQQWVATSEQGGVAFNHSEWRDVPLEAE